MRQIVIVSVLILFIAYCKFKVNDDGSSLASLFTNLQKKSASASVTCEGDSPSVVTKKLTGKILDNESGSAIANTRITTDPLTTTTISDTDGSFAISGIDASVATLTVNLSATGYPLTQIQVSLVCKNSSYVGLISKIQTSAAGVNPCVLGTSTISNCNIQ